LLTEICRFMIKQQNTDPNPQFEEQIHRMLPMVVVQLRNSTPDVSRYHVVCWG
jgi:hypothetical protein